MSRRATTHRELHRISKTQTDNELRQTLWAKQGLVIAMPTDTHELGPEYRFKFTPVGNSLLPHQGDKRGATLPHKLITPSPDGLISLRSDSCSTSILAYEHTQSCPGVTQAVSYEPCFLHPTRRWSRLAGNIRVLALPFSTQIPDSCGSRHLRPAHRLPDVQSVSR